MVPWLGFATFTAVTQVQSLVGEMRSQQPHSVDNNNKKKNAKKGLVDNVKCYKKSSKFRTGNFLID